MIYIFSPLPPKKTGTADYVRFLSHELQVSLGETLFKNEVCFCDTNVEKSYMDGVGNIDSVEKIHPLKGDIIICCLASNIYHCWIWEFLADYDGSAKIISVIHDLSAFSLLLEMAQSGRYRFNYQNLTESLSYEFGFEANYLVKNAYCLGEVPSYFRIAQGITLKKSDLIIVHSYYAKTCLETFIVPGVQLPPIHVASHPIGSLELSETINLPSTDFFCVGAVGWWSKIKQPELLIRAFWHFFCKLKPNEQAKVLLVFVGNIDKQELLKQEQYLREINLSTNVLFKGFVEERVLNSWIKRFNLMFNLRFPSCGETSGTLARAKYLGTKTVTTDFAAFREEFANYHVSVEYKEELEQLIAILTYEWELWKGNTQNMILSANTESRPITQKNSIGRVLLEYLKTYS